MKNKEKIREKLQFLLDEKAISLSQLRVIIILLKVEGIRKGIRILSL